MKKTQKNSLASIRENLNAKNVVLQNENLHQIKGGLSTVEYIII